MGRRKSNFWSGFGVGAAVGGVAVLLPQLLGRSEADRVVRIEKSIQIGRPVDEVFEAWVDWDRLPRVSEHICDISNRGDRSHWRVEIEGQFVEWDAVTTQHIDGQAIGWKSVNGPKHTGRVNFSPIGEDTIVHVTMNYAPPSRFLNPFKTPIGSVMEA